MLRVVAYSYLLAAALSAQDLPRHGIVGLVVQGSPATVQAVVPGGPGDAAGIRAGDVIESLDGKPVESGDQFARAVGRHVAGETARVTVRRAADRLDLSAVLKPRPFETNPDAEVLYRSVDVRGARRRVIVTHPHRPGRLPAVLLMQGLGCYSLDGTDRAGGYGRVLSEFERRGFVTMRVEKTGEGDSDAPLCTDLSATADLEAAGWLAGLRALKTYDFVDPARVFVFAHSMGPVTGSLIAGEEPLRGWISVETIGTSWFEYDIERTRVQAALRVKPDDVDREVRQYEPCSHRFFVEKMTPGELLKTPECARVLNPLAGVPYTYMHSVADISLGRNWRGGDFPVLVVYGTASPVTTAHQSRYLVETINRWRPGRAQYIEIPGMRHDLSRDNGAQFHEGLMEQIFAWLDKL